MRRASMFAAVMLTMTGCAGLQAQDTRATEQLLAEAGFEMKPADSPEKLAHLERLTPRTILRHEVDGQQYYIFADGSGCKCLYAGREPQYEKYRALVRQRIETDEATLVTRESSDFRLWGLAPAP